MNISIKISDLRNRPEFHSILSKGVISGNGQEVILDKDLVTFDIPFVETKEELIRPTPVAMPSLMEQATGFAKSAGKVIVDGIQGKPIYATAEERERRLGICKACELYSDGRCSKCGCNMNFKSGLETLHCPINKW